MKVFIFGAGASQGSQLIQFNHDDKRKSPLTNELFDTKYRPAIPADVITNDVLANCREEIKKFPSLEEWLTERWKDLEKKQFQSKGAEKAFFARISFYIWFLMITVSDTYVGSSNRYSFFMKKLKDRAENFGLISFNYDTLLDKAVVDVFDHPLGNLNDYLSFPLLKIHGSVNWLLQRRNDDPNLPSELNPDYGIRLLHSLAHMFDEAPNYIAQLVVYPPSHIHEGSNRELFSKFGHFYPAIFMPLLEKMYSFISGFEDLVINRAKEILKEASAIYLIGYKANDEIAIEILKSVKDGTPLFTVGRTWNKELADKIMKKLPGKFLFKGSVGGGFENFVEQYESFVV